VIFGCLGARFLERNYAERDCRTALRVLRLYVDCGASGRVCVGPDVKRDCTAFTKLIQVLNKDIRILETLEDRSLVSSERKWGPGKNTLRRIWRTVAT
jgi:hypothetical protein